MRKWQWVMLAMAVMVIAGCTSTGSQADAEAQMKVSSDCWTGEKRKEIQVEKGETIQFAFDSKIDDGDLTMNLYNEVGELVVQFGVDVSDAFEMEVHEGGNYIFVVTGDAFGGKADVTWNINS